MKVRLLSLGIYIIGSVVGLLAFLYPFIWPNLVSNTSIGSARTIEMPLMLTAILGLSLVVLLFEVQGQAVDTKLIALLGVLVALNSALRFIEIAIPGPGGFSPIFFLIILTGYVFGGRFGFLMGSLTMLVSALVTGGVGPWLPGQMLAAGWVGMSAPVLRPLARLFRLNGRYGEVLLLASFGALWGILYGVIMNLWSWPFIAGPAGQSYLPGAGMVESLRLYLTYYLVTSLLWDLMLAAGNAIMLLLFAGPTLRALWRFKRRFEFDYFRLPDPGAETESCAGHAQPVAESGQTPHLTPERAAETG
jgi:energy-coupling factor transport system substrate-specific component